MKRNDFWIVALVSFQLFLFNEILPVAQTRILRVTSLDFLSQPLTTIHFVLVAISLFILFSNFGNIMKFLFIKEDKLESEINSIMLMSISLLGLIFFLKLLPIV